MLLGHVIGMMDGGGGGGPTPPTPPAPPGPVLPYDAEVEYVATSGVEYVETGLTTGGVGVEVEGEWARATPSTSSDLYDPLVGTDDAGFTLFLHNISLSVFDISYWYVRLVDDVGDAAMLSVYSGPFAPWPADVYYQISASTPSGDLATLVAKSGGNTFTAVHAVSAEDGSPSALCLFRGIPDLRMDTRFNAKVKMKYCKISLDGVLMRDYIPVRIGTTGYLYDRANPTGGPPRQRALSTTKRDACART